MARCCRIRLNAPARAAVLRQLRPALDPSADASNASNASAAPDLPDAARCIIHEERLPFYPRLRLYDIADDAAVPPFRQLALIGGGSLFLPDGGVAPLRAANALEGLRLGQGALKAYLSLYLRFIAAPGAATRLVEKLSDFNEIRPFSSTQKQALSGHLHPLRIRHAGGAAPHFLLAGCFVTGNRLDALRFALDRRGELRLLESRLLRANLPLGPANSMPRVA